MLELELVRRNIPYVKFGGLKFLEAAHVKDVLAFLRLLENPRDRVAGFRVLQLLPGVGPEDRGARARRDGRRRSVRGDRCTSRRRTPAPRSGPRSRSRSAYCAANRPAGRLNSNASAAGTNRTSNADTTTPTCARADLRQLEAIAAGYPSRERFLTELTLDPPGATSDEAGAPLKDEDYLILSTIHSAKGQEWKAVTLLNAVDGCIPSDLSTGTTAELEEERRLLYVAMTRAKDHLTIVVPQRFYVHQQGAGGDRHVYASRTRFIPEALAGRFERASWPVAANEAGQAAQRGAGGGSCGADAGDVDLGRSRPVADIALSRQWALQQLLEADA